MPAFRAIFLAAAYILFTASSSLAQPIAMDWQPVDSLNERLPNGIRVYSGRSDSPPLRAWYARIDEPDPAIETRVVVSDEPNRREKVRSFARMPGACLAVNGGYFDMEAEPSRHVGLLLSDDTLHARATPEVYRQGRRYETTRAALGFTATDSITLAWATSRGDTVFAWPAPPRHTSARPAPPLRYDEALPWHVRDALAAGPMLVREGEARVTSDEEVFFGTAIPATHPRTAAGRTADGDLIVMVVDGRQPASRGVDLHELAQLMRDAGAIDALNLDGGGSSTLHVGDVLVNRPEGDTTLRPVMSALVTFCHDR